MQRWEPGLLTPARRSRPACTVPPAPPPPASYELQVAHGLQGHGLGSWLMGAVEAVAAALTCEATMLTVLKCALW